MPRIKMIPYVRHRRSKTVEYIDGDSTIYAVSAPVNVKLASELTPKPSVNVMHRKNVNTNFVCAALQSTELNNLYTTVVAYSA